MTTLEVNGKSIQRDEEGYLVHPENWNDKVAEQLADEEQIKLIALHWNIIKFMRYYYNEHRIIADARFVIKYLAEELDIGKKEARRRLFELFPYGYVKQACKIAGMKRPRAWSTG